MRRTPTPAPVEDAPETAESARRSARLPTHWLRHLLTVVVLGLAVHLLLPQITTLQHSLEVIRGMSWWVLALAVVSMLTSFVGSSLLLRAIARMTGDRLGLVRGALITAASTSVGLVAGGIVPAGVAARRWVRGSGVGPAGALVTLWLPVLLYIGVLAVVTAVGLAYLLLLHQLTVPLAITFASGPGRHQCRHQPRSPGARGGVPVSRTWLRARRHAGLPCGAVPSIPPRRRTGLPASLAGSTGWGRAAGVAQCWERW